MIRKTRIPALSCECDVCHRKWFSLSKRAPTNCPNTECRSREWNGKKTRTMKPKVKIELPKPVRAREEHDLHLWTDDEVQRLKDSGQIVECFELPSKEDRDDDVPF
jgi:hypothetical protein